MTDRKELIDQVSRRRDRARKNRRNEDFGELLERYMREKGFSSTTLSEVSGLSDRTIRRMKGDDMYEPTREMVIAVCVGMKLTYDESSLLLKKSAFRLRADSPVDAVYLEILESEGEFSVLEWNDVLYALGAKLIGGGR